ncbi:MAG: PAS domain S-box protein [Spirochaetes bacterium]|nr:PAS domain S-box protein [Spirochaetota bacterium]
MNFRRKVIIGYVLVISVFTVLTIGNVFYLDYNSDNINEILEKKLRTEKSFNDAILIVNTLHAEIWDIILFDQEKKNQKIEDLDFKAKLFYDSIYDLIRDYPEKKEFFKEINSNFILYYQVGISLAKSPYGNIYSQQDSTQKFKENKDVLISLLNRSVVNSKSELETSLINLKKSSMIALVISIAVAMFAIAGAIIMSLKISGNLIRPIYVLLSAMKKFEQGDLSAHIDACSTDEIGMLSNAFNIMATSLREYMIKREELLSELEFKTINLEREINEKESAQHALKANENELRGIIESMPMALIVADKIGRIIYKNNVFQKIIESDSDIQSVQQLWESIAARSGNRKIRNLWEGSYSIYLKTGYFRPVEMCFHDSLKKTYFELYYANLSNGGIYLINDISIQKLTEEELADERERLAVTLRSIGDAVVSTDINANVVFMNSIAEKLTGWTSQEAKGLPIKEVFNIINEVTRSVVDSPVLKVLETGQIEALSGNTILISRYGNEISIADSAAPILDRRSQIIGVVLVFRDVTEKKILEEEILKKQKLDSLGVLAGGIAHDFNNILTAIMGNINLSRLNDSLDELTVKYLTEAENATKRASHLTQQLLTFAKGGIPIRRTGDIKLLLEESLEFLLRGSNIRYVFEADESLLTVSYDDSQISQVFNNLIINARQAMPGGGVLTTKIENYEAKNETLADIKDGKYIRISFADQGRGISPENVSRIFDPYFTTKSDGHGLGLATVYSIVRKHEGGIRVISGDSNGTTFMIFLPSSDEPVQKSIITKENSNVVHEGRVLVLDDDIQVRETASMILKRIGYNVDLIDSCDEAVNMFKSAKETGKEYKFVILDITIPGDHGGLYVLDKIREIDSNSIAIVSSGYSNDPIMADFLSYGFNGIIVKPYTIEMVKSAIESVL